MSFVPNMAAKVRRSNERFGNTSNRTLPINNAFDRRGGIHL